MEARKDIFKFIDALDYEILRRIPIDNFYILAECPECKTEFFIKLLEYLDIIKDGRRALCEDCILERL